jgi:hypothetical protein
MLAEKQTDGQTDKQAGKQKDRHDETNRGAFRLFAKAPENPISQLLTQTLRDDCHGSVLAA